MTRTALDSYTPRGWPLAPGRAVLDRAVFFTYRQWNMTKKQVTFPASWLAEARDAYSTYKADWEREEIEQSILTGNPPEPPQDWDDFLIEYHYAELENAVFIGFVGSLPASFGE